LAGRTLLRASASFSFCRRSGGAGGVALTGLNFNKCVDGATGATLASLLGVGNLSGRLGTALAGAVLLLCPSLLRRLGPSSHGFP